MALPMPVAVQPTVDFAAFAYAILKPKSLSAYTISRPAPSSR